MSAAYSIVISLVSQGVSQFQNNMTSAAGGVGTLSASAQTLHDRLDRLKGAGDALSSIGKAGLEIMDGMIEANAETANMDKTLESMLKKQGRLQDMSAIMDEIGKVRDMGHFADDGGLKTAAQRLAMANIETKQLTQLLPLMARAARSSGDELDGVADTLAAAYKNMDLKGLEGMKLFFSDADQAAVEAAKSISVAAGQAKFLEFFIAKADGTLAGLNDSLTDGAAAANDLNYQSSVATRNLALGASAAKAGVDSISLSILKCVNASPQLETTAGFVGYIGSAALTAVGGVMALGSQLGMMILSLQAMGITSVSAFGSYIMGALSSVGASISAGAAALTASVGFGTLAATAALATTAVAGLLVAYLGYQDAQTMDDEHLRQKWGPMADVWIGLSGGDGGSDVDHTPEKSETEKKAEELMAKADAAMNTSPSGAVPMPTMTAANIGAPVAMPTISIPAPSSAAPGAPIGAPTSAAPSSVEEQVRATMDATGGNLASILASLAGRGSEKGRDIVTTVPKGAPLAGGDGTKLPELNVGLDGEANIEGKEIVIHLYPRDIRLPYSGLGNLKGKVR
ncbi:hypothetical protein EON83_00010 [bacterium]|nr:MAG: hypothetical protein EON83_00010 [bacterium]